jgi:predicted outer membrane repeat protein
MSPASQSVLLSLLACLAGCGGTEGSSDESGGSGSGSCELPSAAAARDVTNPDHVVGDGTPESCTSQAVVAAVALGGIITFDCGPEPIQIELEETLKIFNDTGPRIVLDGGNKVTLSGQGQRRILYMNTCDEAQHWTTPHCDDQDHPELTVQRLTFVAGNAENEEDGGGAIFARGGRLAVIDSAFRDNTCAALGPDVGGGAIRAFDQSGDQPLYVVGSTFENNICSNGGALSSIGVSYTVAGSEFIFNQAIGNGANPAQAGTPGGGSGGAIYNDGNTFTLTLCDVSISDNTANEGGGAIFFVSNDRSGSLVIRDSELRRNPSGKFETQGYPGIFVLAHGDPLVTNSSIE